MRDGYRMAGRSSWVLGASPRRVGVSLAAPYCFIIGVADLVGLDSRLVLRMKLPFCQRDIEGGVEAPS